MNAKYLSAIILSFLISAAAFGQGQPRPPGQLGGGPPRGEGRPPKGDMGPGRPDGTPDGDWIKLQDTNMNEILEADEFQAACDRTFAALDTNGNGSIEPSEVERPPRPEDGKRQRILPPFFFKERIDDGKAVTRAEFDQFVRGVFNEMDKNSDGALSKAEARVEHPRKGGPEGDGPQRPGMAPNAKFIGAELRFGDKLVKGQPFSAETLIEDTRRLYDGTTVTKQVHGSIYRDGEGRTRREQPLEMVGGVNIVGTDNKPQMLVFINDFATKTQIFLDLNNKVARKNQIGGLQGPSEPIAPNDAKDEYLGVKIINGISAEGTRTSFNIPVGDIGNEKPIQVVSERWFSPELQVIVMSRHIDPLAGEHVFKLVNIKRGEPSADMFSIPTGFKVEDQPMRRPEGRRPE
ncbi:hypothetical protein BH10ACI3_BH10ACI3_00450 [soil metagenome]